MYGFGGKGDPSEDYGSTYDARDEERGSYYHSRATCSMELEPDIESDKYGHTKIRLTAIHEGKEEQSKCCFWTINNNNKNGLI